MHDHMERNIIMIVYPYASITSLVGLPSWYVWPPHCRGGENTQLFIRATFDGYIKIWSRLFELILVVLGGSYNKAAVVNESIQFCPVEKNNFIRR